MPLARHPKLTYSAWRNKVSLITLHKICYLYHFYLEFAQKIFSLVDFIQKDVIHLHANIYIYIYFTVLYLYFLSHLSLCNRRSTKLSSSLAPHHCNVFFRLCTTDYVVCLLHAWSKAKDTIFSSIGQWNCILSAHTVLSLMFVYERLCVC